jgi:hypothetical protein
MADELLVCWTCYRDTNRAIPGTYPHPEGTSTIDGVPSIVITVADVDHWLAVRDARSQ